MRGRRGIGRRRAVTAALLWFACTTPVDPPGPKLTVFDCGSIAFDDVAAFGLTNEETPVRELFVPCYLVEHRGGEG